MPEPFDLASLEAAKQKADAAYNDLKDKHSSIVRSMEALTGASVDGSVRKIKSAINEAGEEVRSKAEEVVTGAARMLEGVFGSIVTGDFGTQFGQALESVQSAFNMLSGGLQASTDEMTSALNDFMSTAQGFDLGSVVEAYTLRFGAEALKSGLMKPLLDTERLYTERAGNIANILSGFASGAEEGRNAARTLDEQVQSLMHQMFLTGQVTGMSEAQITSI